MVSLNCLTLEKPAAKAISAARSWVVSRRIRAVWARLGAGEGERTRPHLGYQQPVQMTLAVTESPR